MCIFKTSEKVDIVNGFFVHMFTSGSHYFLMLLSLCSQNGDDKPRKLKRKPKLDRPRSLINALSNPVQDEVHRTYMYIIMCNMYIFLLPKGM